jgi:membrane-bound serine protease (ClpP class)
MLNIGSFMIFKSEDGGFAVSPVIAIVVLLVNAPILWIVVKKIIEAIDKVPDFDPENIVGNVGVARTNILNDGTAYVAGEEWSARSETRIERGEKVRVVRKEGLILWVEKIEND